MGLSALKAFWLYEANGSTEKENRNGSHNLAIVVYARELIPDRPLAVKSQ